MQSDITQHFSTLQSRISPFCKRKLELLHRKSQHVPWQHIEGCYGVGARHDNAVVDGSAWPRSGSGSAVQCSAVQWQRFPLLDIGGWQWRGSGSAVQCSGSAVRGSGRGQNVVQCPNSINKSCPPGHLWPPVVSHF